MTPVVVPKPPTYTDQRTLLLIRAPRPSVDRHKAGDEGIYRPIANPFAPA